MNLEYLAYSADTVLSLVRKDQLYLRPSISADCFKRHSSSLVRCFSCVANVLFFRFQEMIALLKGICLVVILRPTTDRCDR